MQTDGFRDGVDYYPGFHLAQRSLQEQATWTRLTARKALTRPTLTGRPVKDKCLGLSMRSNLVKRRNGVDPPFHLAIQLPVAQAKQTAHVRPESASRAAMVLSAASKPQGSSSRQHEDLAPVQCDVQALNFSCTNAWPTDATGPSPCMKPTPERRLACSALCATL